MKFPELEKYDPTYGYEYEIADVLLVDAAKAVFEKQGFSFEDWQDRSLDHKQSSKIRKYEIYNISSDGAVFNNNGTKAMATCWNPEEERVERCKPENIHLWQTAELVSPVKRYMKIDEEWSEFEDYLSLLQSLGGVVSPWNWNDFNVHVGIDGWDLDKLKEHIEWQYRCQDIFREFRLQVDDTKFFSPDRFRWSRTAYNRFMQSKDLEEAWAAYRQQQSRDRVTKEPVHWSNFWKKLHPADPSSFLNPELPHNTLEWRSWPMLDDPIILKEIVEFSVKNTFEPVEPDLVREWVDYWGAEASKIKSKKPENLHRKRDW